MARRVIIAPKAREDLAGIRRWQLQPGSGSAARRRVLHILVAIQRLAEHPYIGQPGTRFLVVERHTVLYAVRGNGDIVVARVFGPYQDHESGTEYES